MEEEKTIRDEIKELKDIVVEEAQKKRKKFKMPLRARLSKIKLRQGYVTVAKIDENKTVDFFREPIIDGTIKLDDTFHAVADFDVFTYKGKPIIFQAKNKLNPYNPLTGTHDTYGQKYVIARMEGDKIISKRKIGWGVGIVGAVIIIGIIVYALFTG